MAALALLPRVVVSSPSVPFDPNNVFSISFDISNVNFIPLHDVAVAVGLGQTGNKASKPDPNLIPSFKSQISRFEWLHHDLGMDERFTINLTEFIRGEAAYADIAIVVSYKPWLLPVRRQKLFRFVTYKETNGESRWRSWPTGERPPRFDE